MIKRQVDFAQLLDGSLVEMIEDPGDPTRPLFAVYKNGAVRCVSSIDEGNIRWVPWPRTDPGTSHVRLAQGVESFGHIKDLQAHVGSIFFHCLDIEPETQVLLATFVMATWLPEKMPVAPYLAFVGPPGSGKTTAMRVLAQLCYRSFLTADISSAGFYELSQRMRPTLLLDETLTAGRSRELMHLLKSTSTPGIASLRKGKSFLAYGPKVFSWLQLPEDDALNSRCVILPMVKTSRRDLLVPNDPKMLQAAAKIRMELLRFRFENLRTPRVADVPKIPLSGRSLDLYRALAAPFTNYEQGREFVARYIWLRQKSQTEVLTTAQASILRFLYDYIHEDSDEIGPMVSAVTAAVNSDLSQRGEPGHLTGKRIGNLLTSLSFMDRPRTNKGFVVRLERSAREKIHHTVRQYALAEPRGGCDMCSRTATTATASGAANLRDDHANREVHASSGDQFSQTGSDGEHGERCEHRARSRGRDRKKSSIARTTPRRPARR